MMASINPVSTPLNLLVLRVEAPTVSLAELLSRNSIYEYLFHFRVSHLLRILSQLTSKFTADHLP